MASPGQVIQSLADVLGLPVAAVTNSDRALLKAKLRIASGRGPHAAPMTARCVAYLSTAILGSNQILQAAQTVERYQTTRPRLSASTDGLFSKLGIEGLDQISDHSSFVDALECLISVTAEGMLLKSLWREKGTPPPLIEIAPLIDVVARTPGTVGEIRISGLPNRRTAHVVFTLSEPSPVATKSSGARRNNFADKHRVTGDLTQERRISARTIITLGELLNKDR